MFVCIERAIRRLRCRSSSSNESGIGESLSYDDIFFRLYYRITGSILLLISICIVLREWSIDAIDCNVPATVVTDITTVGGEISYHRMNSYCKMQNRFISIDDFSIRSATCNSNSPLSGAGRRVKTVPKYQLFSLIFFSSAIIVTLPHIIWKCSNQSMIKSVVNRLRQQVSGSFKASQTVPLDRLLRVSLDSFANDGHQYMFCAFYIALKIANALILFGLIVIADILLHGMFLGYPVYFLHKIQMSDTLLDQRNLNSALAKLSNCSSPKNDPFRDYYEDIFPKYALCPYTYLEEKTGESKLVLVNCLMPINSMLEQIFFFLWIWYGLLVLFTMIDFLRYAVLFCHRPLRRMTLKYNTNSILAEATYQQASKSFSSWLFTQLVIIDNHHHHHQVQPSQESLLDQAYISMNTLTPILSGSSTTRRSNSVHSRRFMRLAIIPEENEAEDDALTGESDTRV